WSDDPVPNPALNPACYYWGDGDGDGIIGPGDVVTVQLEIAGNAQSYANVIPSAFDTLDLDKDDIPGPNDKTLLDVMFTGGDRASGYPSSPDALTVVSQPGGAIAVGSTTHVTLSLENSSVFVPHSGGFAVVFSISSGSATLLGGEGTDLAGPPGNRYDVTALSTASGQATIVIRVDGAGPITLSAKVPACGTEPLGRWCEEVQLMPSIVITGE
ncbi:MAG: hypothetical protein GY856_29805, partial [bacterium]|nr:hypothetical protein [bacterium]